MGHAPQSFAKAASERIRSGLSPNRINISAAGWAPTPKLARSVGDVSVVSRSRCRSCVAISSARVVHRRASARRVCLVDAVGVSSGPGRSPAQRVSRLRSVRSWRASRSGAGARTTICFRVIIATVRRGIAAQFVGDQSARRAALSFQQFPKETGGRPSITPGLDEDVDHVTILVNRPPEIPTPALNLHKQLVEIPGVAQAPSPSPQRPRVRRTKGSTPLSNRLIGHGDPTLREQVLGIAETQAEPVIQPHGVADDFRRKSVSGVTEV